MTTKDVVLEVTGLTDAQLSDVVVGLAERAQAGDRQAAALHKGVTRNVKRLSTLSYAIVDMSERAQRPTILEAKRQDYAKRVAECRTNLPLVEVQLKRFVKEAVEYLAAGEC